MDINQERAMTEAKALVETYGLLGAQAFAREVYRQLVAIPLYVPMEYACHFDETP